jgi:anaerobic selenocysteine-containing dehydrogenase
VIDPRRTEAAELADYHLALRPGTDAWCLAALAAVLVQEELLDRPWLKEHTVGLAAVEPVLAATDVEAFAGICDLEPEFIRQTARRIAAATSVAVFEDLGVQMNLHSTLCSYLDKLLWLLTGNFANPGGQYIPSSIVALAGGGGSGTRPAAGRRSPVANALIISGLVPCNVIADEILTDHPDRYRAMLVESANPAHSLADTPRMRQALEALEFVVVIDVAMTETAQLADYVLPASSQFEKWEATFFNFEFPRNYFHLRRPVLEPLPGSRPEPEIHARLVETLGALDGVDLTALADAARRSRAEFGPAFLQFMAEHPGLGPLTPVILYTHPGTHTSWRRRFCRAAVGCRPPMRGSQPAQPRTSRLRWRGRGPRRGFVRRHSHQPERPDFHRRCPCRQLAPGPHARRRPEPPDRRAAGRSGRRPHCRSSNRAPRLPSRADRRRTASVHRQHHLP